MPKLKNITSYDIAEAVRNSDEVTMTIQELADMVRKGYCDTIDLPLEYAKALSTLSMHASSLASAILIKEGMDARARDTEALLRANS